MGEIFRVDTGDLERKSNQVEALSESALETFDVGNEVLDAPDTLPGTDAAISNLRASLAAVKSHQEWAHNESNRIGELLKNVAKTYNDVDQRSWESINNDDALPSAPEPLKPAPPSTPPTGQPQTAGAPTEVADQADLEPPQVQALLNAGDDGSSLTVAIKEWDDTATKLNRAADNFTIEGVDWYGDAADDAYTTFKTFGDYLRQLATAWTSLATQGSKILDAHKWMKEAHQPVADAYFDAHENSRQGIDEEANNKIMQEMRLESERLRGQYVNARKIDKVEVASPPPAVSTQPGTGVTTNGDPRDPAGVPPEGDKPGTTSTTEGTGTGTGTGAGNGSSGAADPGQTATPGEPAVSPASAQESSGQSSSGQNSGSSGQGSGSGSGSSGGSGSQSGGQGSGSPSGMPSTGLPKTGEPKLPTDPSLEPAGAGGGSGGGSGGGGGGGGVSAPLGPPVGAETVTANPAAAKGGVPAGAGAAAGGVMGGGMGGMPMGHGAGGQGQGTQEKKRNPALSLDEEIYTEDRPYTDGVIGHRPRRKEGPDKDSK